MRCFSLESFQHSGQFLVADKETCKCVFRQYIPVEKFMRDATWAVLKLNDEESDEEENAVVEAF